jgi:hypothetical protein
MRGRHGDQMSTRKPTSTSLAHGALEAPAENAEARRFAAGFRMELGGLEPPTSWVRCARSARLFRIKRYQFAGDL